MQQNGVEAIRNLGLFGHQGSGKTSLTEALLYVAGAIDRLGRTDDGTTVCDFDSEEQKRHISINTAIAALSWHDVRINVVDAPGYLDFVGEVQSAMQVVESAVIVTSAQSEPEVGFDIAWNIAAARNLPRAVFVNKMDRENADFDAVVSFLRSKYGNCVAPLQIPVGAGEKLNGVIDLIEMKAFLGTGRDVECVEIPAELRAEAERYRELLVESAAEGDDLLIEKFLSGEQLSHDEVVRGLHEGIDAGKVVPVLCGSALKDVGMTDLLDIVVHEFPNPTEVGEVHGVQPATGAEQSRRCAESDPTAAIVFKTIADPFLGTLSYFRVMSGTIKPGTSFLNATTMKEERLGQVYHPRGKNHEPAQLLLAGDIGVTAKLVDTHTGDTLCDAAKPIKLDFPSTPEPCFEQAIQARTKVDEDKMGPALQRVTASDPAFKTYRDSETGQTVICGAGETHLATVVERLRKFGSNVDIIERRVPYRETVTQKAEGQGRHKKQTGGRGQFGDCHIRLEPNPGKGIEFVDAIVGGSIPRQFIPAVEKGIRQAAATGIQAGCTAIDIKATCYDGSYHDVDSSEAAFIMAGIIAFNTVALKAHPVLLEPIMAVEVTIPDGMLGDVMSDLSGKRGRILGTETFAGGTTVLKASVPQSEMLRYAIDLRSITRGRGSFRAEVAHYEETPPHIAQQVIAEHHKESGAN